MHKISVLKSFYVTFYMIRGVRSAFVLIPVSITLHYFLCNLSKSERTAAHTSAFYMPIGNITCQAGLLLTLVVLLAHVSSAPLYYFCLSLCCYVGVKWLKVDYNTAA